MLVRFAYGGFERVELTDWVVQTALWAERNPKVEKLLHGHVDDVSVPTCRNRAVLEAIQQGVDILIMADHDMAPDIDKSKMFVADGFEFITKRWHDAPTVLGAPYRSGVGNKQPQIGVWRTHHDSQNVTLEKYSNEEGQDMHGIQPVAWLGTGLMMLDLRVCTGFPAPDGKPLALATPWFAEEFDEPYQTKRVCGEDVYFTRNASVVFGEHDIPVVFCAWDHWSDHMKIDGAGRPVTVTSTDLGRLLGPLANAKRAT